MHKLDKRRDLLVYLIVCLGLFCITIIPGCRIIDANFDDDTELAATGGIASSTGNPLWQQELLTVQQALADARKKNPTISWVAADNPVLRNFSTQEMRNLTGDQGLNELPQSFLNVVPPALVKEVELSAGENQSPNELFSMGGLSVAGELIGARSLGQRAAFELPPSISWRNKEGQNWLTPVRHQSSYNTCTVFAAVGALESAMKIARADPNWEIDLSEAYAWYYGTAHFNAANGNIPLPKSVDSWNTAFATAFMLPPFGGIPLETFAPYESHINNYDLFSGSPNPDEKFAANGLFVFRGVTALKMALQKGPVVGSMIVDKFFQSFGEGIYEKLPDPANTVVGNHAIIFVGYNDSENYWECKNSWGDSWGDHGYFRIRQGDPNLILIRNNYLLSVPVAVTGRFPLPGVIVEPDVTISVNFGEALLESSVTSGTFSIIDAETRQALPGSLTLSNNGRQITFAPAQPLPIGRMFICTVNTGIRSLDGDTLAQNDTWAFSTTGAVNPPPVALWILTPDKVSGEKNARFQAGGIGIVAMRYRLDQDSFGAEFPASNTIHLSNLQNGEHTLQVIGRTADGIWQDEANATVWTWTVASQIGRAVIIGAPAPVSIDIDLTFTWIGEGDVAATKTNINDSAFWSKEYLPDVNGIFTRDDSNFLKIGTYTFRIIAKNAAGIWQPPASATVFNWYVNPALSAPLTLSGLPPLQTRTTQATITVSGKDVTEYQFNHNSRLLSMKMAINEPLVLSGLSVGTHTVQIRSIDTLGVAQPITLASSYTWTIMPPLAEFATMPEKVSGSETARFVASGEEIIEIRYRLDGAAFSVAQPVAQPVILEGLADGEHTLQLIGRNAAGTWQEEAMATTWIWTVAANVGQAIIQEKPELLSFVNTLPFSWTVEGAVAATRTRLDESPDWSTEILPDNNGLYVTNDANPLSNGTHTFQIIARNSAGIWQLPASAAVYTWYVNPALNNPLTISGLPTTGQTRSTQATLSISGQGADEYQYALDGANLSNKALLNTPLVLSGLSQGDHTLLVRSIDNLGVAQPLAVASSQTWTILPPLTELASKPAAVSEEHTARFVVSGEEIVEIRYRFDGEPFSVALPATQPIILDNLADGEHTLQLIGRNAAGTWQSEQMATTWTWRVTPRVISKQWGSAGWDNPEDITTDATGNAYLVGLTDSTLDGNISAGGIDAFITKVASDGQRIWTKQFGSAFYDKAKGVAIAPDGDILIVGTTNGALPGQTHGGDYDLWLARYTPDGTQRWLRQYGLDTAEDAEKVVVDQTGTIHVSGTSYEVTSQVGMLLMRFDANGEQIFRQSFAIGHTTASRGIAVDAQGNSYITGGINSTFNGKIPIGGSDCAVIKVLANGNIGWVKFLGTSSDDRGSDVAVDAAGNIYVTGDTLGNFDGQFSYGALDVFLTKLDSSGNTLWAIQFGSAKDDDCSDLVLDSSGAPIICGTIQGPIFDKPAPGGYDMFVTSWSTSGNLVWAGIYGTANSDSNPKLARDGIHPFTLAGSTDGSLSGFTNAGSNDLIMLRINELGTLK